MGLKQHALAATGVRKGLLARLETFRTVADFTYDWETWIGQDGRVRYVSPSCQRISGYTPQEILAADDFFASIIHPADLNAWRTAMTESPSDRAPSIDFRIIRKDGRQVWLAQETTRVNGPCGQPRGLRLSLRDVTDRVAAQLALRQAHEELEDRVAHRTRELNQANRELRQEIRRGKRIRKELEDSRKRLQDLTSYLHERIEAERARIAREIHDELGQNLTAINLGLFSLEQAAGHGEQSARDRLATMKELTVSSIATVQRIARELRPALLDELGLTEAVAWRARAFEQATGLSVLLTMPDKPLPLDAEQATALYRVFQESLTNVARHARASRVLVRLWLKRGRLGLEVADNGVGIAPGAQDNPQSLGLAGMRERMRGIGGVLAVTARPEGGTLVAVTLPLATRRAGPKAQPR